MKSISFCILVAVIFSLNAFSAQAVVETEAVAAVNSESAAVNFESAAVNFESAAVLGTESALSAVTVAKGLSLKSLLIAGVGFGALDAISNENLASVIPPPQSPLQPLQPIEPPPSTTPSTSETGPSSTDSTGSTSGSTSTTSR